MGHGAADGYRPAQAEPEVLGRGDSVTDSWDAASEQREEEREERREVARHVLWYNGDPRGYQPGSFTSKLLEAWTSADGQNDMRLRTAFPILGEAVQLSRTLGSDAVAEWAGLT